MFNTAQAKFTKAVAKNKCIVYANYPFQTNCQFDKLQTRKWTYGNVWGKIVKECNKKEQPFFVSIMKRAKRIAFESQGFDLEGNEAIA